MPVDQRVTFKILVTTYKALNDLAPPYIKSLLTPYAPSRSLRSSTKLSLVPPRFHTKTYGARAFSRLAPVEFNKLPAAIREAPSLAVFKANLKTFLFSAAFYC